ncbi:unnamed protein product [Urochloa humidicola]
MAAPPSPPPPPPRASARSPYSPCLSRPRPHLRLRQGCRHQLEMALSGWRRSAAVLPQQKRCRRGRRGLRQGCQPLRRREDEHGRCEHYRRRCKIVALCCKKVFSCRHCHNEATAKEDLTKVTHKVTFDIEINGNPAEVVQAKSKEDDESKVQQHIEAQGINQVSDEELGNEGEWLQM